MIGWDHPDTARYYQAHCAVHPRYPAANENLAWQAFLAPHHRVLDVGAGIGGTSEAILPWLSEAGRIVAFEPAEAMRAMGRMRVRDARVLWVDALPDGPFDRILCGAAIWQMLPLERTFQRLASLLSPGGALCFNIPSLYLGEPDDPGGGSDANLLALPALLGANSTAAAVAPLPSTGVIGSLLTEYGLHPVPWRFRHPLTQETYRDWLKIPVLTNHWFGPLDAAERERRIDSAFQSVERESWRWEAWSGWTAWRAEAPPPSYLPKHQPFIEPCGTDGYLYVRGLLDPAQVLALRSRVEEVHHRLLTLLDLQRAVAVLPEWEALRTHPAVIGTLRQFLGQDVHPHSGGVCRIVPPGAPGAATPPHQDEFFVRRPLWTVWIPLGDCPLRLGPLAVLPGSHRQGIRRHIDDQIAETDATGWWAASSMSRGDVLMFEGRMVHRACPNLTHDTIRFSVDFRYSPGNGPSSGDK